MKFVFVSKFRELDQIRQTKILQYIYLKIFFVFENSYIVKNDNIDIFTITISWKPGLREGGGGLDKSYSHPFHVCTSKCRLINTSDT